MRRATLQLVLGACAALLACGITRAGTIASLDDIVFWTGAGANRAALVIDFDGDATTDNALAWGFRWEGTATGRDMLNALVTADARLFVRIGDAPPTLNGVLGWGYDRNNDGAFAIAPGGSFDGDGFAFGSPNETAAAIELADWYREGWFDGFWHYSLSVGNPWTTGSWVNSQLGASLRPLQNGDWDSWAFTTDADHPSYYNTVFAANPVIATPPGGYADFDADGDVDGADFLAWQRGAGLGAPTPMQGDATSDGSVDGADLAVWRTQFAGSAAAPHLSAVPEPQLCTSCASAMFVLCHRIGQQRSRQRRSAS
jgi:hypothetical protein